MPKNSRQLAIRAAVLLPNAVEQVEKELAGKQLNIQDFTLAVEKVSEPATLGQLLTWLLDNNQHDVLETLSISVIQPMLVDEVFIQSICHLLRNSPLQKFYLLLRLTGDQFLLLNSTIKQSIELKKSNLSTLQALTDEAIVAATKDENSILEITLTQTSLARAVYTLNLKDISTVKLPIETPLLNSESNVIPFEVLGQQYHLELTPEDLFLKNVIKKKGGKTHIFGGHNLATLAGIKANDTDFITDLSYQQLATCPEFRGKLTLRGRTKISARICINDQMIDVVSSDGKTLYEISLGCDLNINALFLNADTGELSDFHEGATDFILEKTFRLIGGPEELARDPIRLFRILRFAAKYNLRISDDIKAAIIDNLKLLVIYTSELTSEKYNTDNAAKYITRFRLQESFKKLLDIQPEIKEILRTEYQCPETVLTMLSNNTKSEPARVSLAPQSSSEPSSQNVQLPELLPVQTNKLLTEELLASISNHYDSKNAKKLLHDFFQEHLNTTKSKECLANKIEEIINDAYFQEVLATLLTKYPALESFVCGHLILLSDPEFPERVYGYYALFSEESLINIQQRTSAIYYSLLGDACFRTEQQIAAYNAAISSIVEIQTLTAGDERLLSELRGKLSALQESSPLEQAEPTPGEAPKLTSLTLLTPPTQTPEDAALPSSSQMDTSAPIIEEQLEEKLKEHILVGLASPDDFKNTDFNLFSVEDLYQLITNSLPEIYQAPKESVIQLTEKIIPLLLVYPKKLKPVLEKITLNDLAKINLQILFLTIVPAKNSPISLLGELSLNHLGQEMKLALTQHPDIEEIYQKYSSDDAFKQSLHGFEILEQPKISILLSHFQKPFIYLFSPKKEKKNIKIKNFEKQVAEIRMDSSFLAQVAEKFPSLMSLASAHHAIFLNHEYIEKITSYYNALQDKHPDDINRADATYYHLLGNVYSETNPDNACQAYEQAMLAVAKIETRSITNEDWDIFFNSRIKLFQLKSEHHHPQLMYDVLKEDYSKYIYYLLDCVVKMFTSKRVNPDFFIYLLNEFTIFPLEHTEKNKRILSYYEKLYTLLDAYQRKAGEEPFNHLIATLLKETGMFGLAAEYYKDAGNYESAIYCLNLSPKDNETCFELALCYFEMGEFQKALDELNSIRADQRENKIHYEIARCYYMMGEFQKALDALDLIPDDQKSLDQLKATILCHQELKNYDAAKHYLNLLPKESEVYAQLAESLDNDYAARSCTP